MSDINKIKNKLDVFESWFEERYKIMEYSFEVHDKLRKLIKSDASEKEIVKSYVKEVSELYAGEPEPLSRRNTAYYIWGHLKNVVTKNEKKRIFSLLEHLDGDADDFTDIKKEFHALMLKYDVENLLNSNYFQDIS